MKKIFLMIMMSIFLTACGRNENELIMVTEAGFAPFEYYEKGEIVGVDVEIAKEVAKELGISQSYISRIEKKVISKLKIQNR